MKVLIIGSGGREHALAWKVKQSKLCSELYILPGNAGTAQVGINLPGKPMEFGGICDQIVLNSIEFVIVGPDDPLGMGIVDYLNAELPHLPVLGPRKDGAKLESSKAFAKHFMNKYQIPTAGHFTFRKEEKEQAVTVIEKSAFPLVMKADGLAAGKGVVICHERTDAIQFLNDCWQDGKFGTAGDTIVIEEFLKGIEVSMFILTDGKNYIMLPEAKDYKRIGEGDTGLNTGGMGAISPVPFADETFKEKVKTQIIEPTMKGLRSENIDYRGFIFFGLINVKGNPYVIEYNSRLGDPETEAILPRVKDDLLPLFYEAANGQIGTAQPEFSAETAATLIAVSKGYPEGYSTGYEITGMDQIADSIPFIAGATIKDSKTVSSGGRVLALTTLAPTLNAALEKGYENLSKIHFENIAYRNDIGADLLNYQQETIKI